MSGREHKLGMGDQVGLVDEGSRHADHDGEGRDQLRRTAENRTIHGTYQEEQGMAIRLAATTVPPRDR